MFTRRLIRPSQHLDFKLLSTFLAPSWSPLSGNDDPIIGGNFTSATSTDTTKLHPSSPAYSLWIGLQHVFPTVLPLLGPNQSPSATTASSAPLGRQPAASFNIASGPDSFHPCRMPKFFVISLQADRQASVMPEGKWANHEEKMLKSTFRAPVIVKKVLDTEGLETMVNEPPERLRYWACNKDTRYSPDLPRL
ncbi:hypothetical protein HPB47_008218 [Ixodes persulcatus]|uniref:Uncharacterized protein n=1 Tax=Ixodes persulcatus TaxID=34615 RepID=A0AC60P5B2_IXOPE|nr:hypothetical protein HPB47_008218 [Ixodes persulcatus]